MTRWGMVIDLHKCVGCEACARACKQTNQVPPDRWRRVIDAGVAEFDPVGKLRTFVHLSCMHCGDPPCEEVCPTGATYRRPDGIVASTYELCIGCGYCVLACPYQARTIVGRGEWVLDAEVALEIGTSTDPDRIGVSTKCDFCLPRIEAGLEQGLRPGLDPEATPACVLACTASALHFGDLEDPESEVSRLIRENQTARLQAGGSPDDLREELDTDPSVYYILA